MPQQKRFQVDPGNPAEVEALFRLAQALVMDGWGATVSANANFAFMTTNAPMNIVNFHVSKQTV